MDMREVVRVARRQGGVVSVRQVLRLGIPRTSLHRATTTWDLARPHRGVLVLPGADPEAPLTRAWVALCAVGSPAWLGGLAALAAVDVVRDPAILDVVVPSARKPTPPATARLRRLHLEAQDVARRGTLPVLAVPRALSEVAALEPRHETLGAVAAAVQRGHVALDELDRLTGRVRNGAPALRAVVADLRGSAAQSALAHRVVRLLAAHGLRTRSEVEVVHRGRQARLDLVVTGTRVAIEVDGHANHSTRRALAEDRRRQNGLVLGGWVVLRVDWLRLLDDALGFVAEVRAAATAGSGVDLTPDVAHLPHAERSRRQG